MEVTRSPQHLCSSSILISVDSPAAASVSQDVVCLVPSVFSKRLFDVHLNVISQIRMQGAHVVNARDLEWWGVSGVWGVAARSVLLASQVRVKPLPCFRAGHRCIGKFLTERAVGIYKFLLSL